MARKCRPKATPTGTDLKGVLVVDDEYYWRYRAKTLIENKLPCRVDGIPYAPSDVGHVRDYDLIVLDLSLQSGTDDGYAFLDRIRDSDQTHSKPVVVWSNYIDSVTARMRASDQYTFPVDKRCSERDFLACIAGALQLVQDAEELGRTIHLDEPE